MNQPHYKWYSYNLNTACEKCGDRIIFQDPNDDMVCKSCGTQSDYTWNEMLELIRLEDIKKKDSGTQTLLGKVEARSTYETVEKINCCYCKTGMTITPEMDLTDYHCSHCSKPIKFTTVANLYDYVFYSCKTNSNESSTPTLIAVRCVSCGAPLEADPTKPNYHCKFCSTENVLPMSLRFKVVVNDVFIGIRRNFFPKELVFSKNPAEVLKSLKYNGISSLKDEEINQILKNHVANTAIYFEIMGQEYEVPKEIEEETFNLCTNIQQIKIIGHRLGKTNEEIDARLLAVDPNYKPATKLKPSEQSTKTTKTDNSPPKKEGFFKKFFG